MTLLNTLRRNIDIVFLIVVAVFAHMLPIPDIIRAFSAIPLLLIIPIRIGFVVTSLFRVTSILRCLGIILRLVFLWSTGIILILALAAFSAFFNCFNLDLLVLITLTFSSLPLLVNLVGRPLLSIIQLDSVENVMSLKKIIPLLLASVPGLVVAFYFRVYSDFPYQPVTDVLAENVIFNKIFFENFFAFSRADYSLTFVFSGKTPLLPLLVAILCRLLVTDYISICWTLPFLNASLFSLGSYLLAYGLTKNQFTSYIACFISVWIGEYSKPTYIHPLQSSLAMVFLPYLFLLFHRVYKIQGSQKHQWKQNTLLVVLLASLAFLSLHYPLGIYVLVLSAISCMLFRILKGFNQNIRFLGISSTSLLFIIFLLARGYVSLDKYAFDPISLLFGVEGTSYSLPIKIASMNTWYGYPIFYLSLVVAALVVLYGLITNSKTCTRMIWATFFFMLNLLLFFLPIANIHRIFPILHLFIAIFSAFAVTSISRLLNIQGNKMIIVTIIILLLLMGGAIR